MIDGIELRWVESGDGHDDDPIRQDLQYRFQIAPLGEWSEWIDVWVISFSLNRIESAKGTPLIEPAFNIFSKRLIYFPLLFVC